MYDLVVLGGGAGGLGVAIGAAKLGARVALIEKGRLGGECTHSACVPSKALIRAASLAHEIRHADTFGVSVGAPEVDFPAVMARVRSVVARFAGSDTGDGLRAKGVEVFRGSPRFESYDTVLVEGQEPIESRRFVIATGSRPAIPAIQGLVEAGFLDNRTIWGLEELPESLVIIGGGPVALEFGQAFARLGSEVTILSRSTHLLPREDPEVSEFVKAALIAEGITVHTSAQVNGVAVRDGRKVCDFRNQADGSLGQAVGTQLLVATGRLANVAGLNLDAVGIHAEPEHGIEVDDYLQTRTRNIYAVGDVLGRHQYTHAAGREAAVVVHNAMILQSRRMDYSTMPRVTFIDPEVATVGTLDPEEAGNAHGEASTYRVAFQDADRPIIDGRTGGFAKVLATPSGKILGATVAGPEAAAILQEFVLAMVNHLGLDEIAAAVHPYPTYSAIAVSLATQHTAARREGGFFRSAIRLLHGYDADTPPRRREPATPAAVAQHDGH